MTPSLHAPRQAHPPIPGRLSALRRLSPTIHRRGEGISLQDLLNLVIAGARGNGQAGEQAYKIAQALQQPGSPPEIAALGQGLQRVLEGLRGEEATADLPEEAAQVCRRLRRRHPASA